MNSADLLSQIARVGRNTPAGILSELSDALDRLGADSSFEQRRMLVAKIPQTAVREDVTTLVDTWESKCPNLSPSAISWALLAASAADEYQRNWQSVELVWTGPTGIESSLRRTDQVLLGLINAASRSVTIVTFVAYKIPEVSAALVKAARRGVRVTLIVESAEVSEGKVATEALQALSEEVARVSDVYVWPLDERPRDADGHYGSLHVKCAIADDDSVLISSANLTGHAMNLNMELGVLVRGGDTAVRLSKHLRRLISEGALVRF